MGAISELYHGKISAPTDIKVRTEEYDRKNELADELYNQIADMSTEDTINLLEELIDIHREMEAITSKDSYTRGFRDGAGLMLDVLNG